MTTLLYAMLSTEAALEIGGVMDLPYFTKDYGMGIDDDGKGKGAEYVIVNKTTGVIEWRGAVLPLALDHLYELQTGLSRRLVGINNEAGTA